MFLEKNMKRHPRLKLIVLLVAAIAFALLASVIVYASQIKQVTIDYKGQKMVVKTMSNTVKDVLAENQIKIDNDDIVKPQLNYMLGSINSISIQDAVVRTVNAQNNTSTLSKIQLVNSNKLAEVTNLAITNIRKDEQKIEKKEIVVKSKIPFETERQPNSRLKKGITKVVKSGKEGLLEKSYQVVYRGGKEVSRKLTNKKVISKPVNKVVQYGTAATVVTSRGDTVRYKRSIEMRATAYSACFADTGKRPGDEGFGITATGMRARPGVVAVDPRVIPLGTRLYIESMQNGVPDYGMAIAGDTGGAIKGNKVDLFFNSSREVDNWGVRKVRVYILD